MSECRNFCNQNEIYTNSNIPKLGLAFPLNSTRETTFSEVIVWARGEAPLHPWIIPPPPVRHVRGHGGACKVPIFAASQSQCKCKCHRAFHDQINTCMLCLSGIQSTLVNGKSFDSTEEIQRLRKIHFLIRLLAKPPTATEPQFGQAAKLAVKDMIDCPARMYNSLHDPAAHITV